MTTQDKDRIECAIRHIESSLDVDPWAVKIAVRAMRKQIPKKPVQDGYEYNDWVCPTCGCFLAPEPKKIGNHHCWCGQAIDWEEE